MRLNKKNSFLKRIAATILAAAVTVSNIQIPVSAAPSSYSNYLDGWTVDVAWSTLSRDYAWDSVKAESRQPKIVVTYRIENPGREFPAGSVKFTIPGIGNANRASVLKASDIAADDPNSEWNYTWDRNTDTYTFTNKKTFENKSMSGGFELLWTLQSRQSTNGFEQSASPTFSVSGSGQITLQPLSYRFSSVKDNYRIDFDSVTKLTPDDYGNEDQSYAWYDIRTKFNADVKSRGLYRSSYFVSIDLPAGASYSDVIVKKGGTTIPLIEKDGKHGFYQFQDKSGDVAVSGNYSSTHYETFRIGFKRDTLGGKIVTVHGHMDRLYNDESTWVTASMNANDVVDAERTFTAENYQFHFTGNIYDVEKYAPYSYNEWGEKEPTRSVDRLNAVNLYNGKVIEYRLYGSASRGYSTAANKGLMYYIGEATPSEADPEGNETGINSVIVRNATATPSEASKHAEEWDGTLPDGVYDWNDINWKEHGLGEEPEDFYDEETIPYSEAKEYRDTVETDEEGHLYIPDIIIHAVKNFLSSASQVITDPWKTYVYAAEKDEEGEGSVTEASETAKGESDDVSEEAAGNEDEAEPEKSEKEQEGLPNDSAVLEDSRDSLTETEASGETKEEDVQDTIQDTASEEPGQEENGSAENAADAESKESDDASAPGTQPETQPETENAEDSGNSESETQIAPLIGDHPTKVNPTGSEYTGIGETEKYCMILGDDKLAIILNNGGIRHLEDDEYSFAYVTVPYNSKNYDYDVWGAKTQDTFYDDYEMIGSGNTSSKKTIVFPDNTYKAIFVRFKDVVGSCSVSAYPGVRFHLDWDEEQAKPVDERPSHTQHVANFDYLRAVYVRDGYDITDNANGETIQYGGTYGKELLARDQSLYGETLMRDYGNSYLREPITKLSATASLSSFSGDVQGGFRTRLSASGNITADNEGPLEKFSLYAVIPDGVQVDIDSEDVAISGSGTYQDGSYESDFLSHAEIHMEEYQGHKVVVADFDFSGMPLEISKGTNVSMSFGGTLSYADFIGYGNYYEMNAYLLAQDKGISNVNGNYIRNDQYDIDQDGDTGEKMAYSSSSKNVDDTASEWREYVSKYVKSYYSSGYVTDTVTRIYKEGNNTHGESDYSYRLDFGLGSNCAKNIIFYDRLEQGASIANNEGVGSGYTEIPSEWQGTFVSVDTSYAQSMKMIPTVYYSENANQTFDLSAGGWSTSAPADKSRVKTIAVKLDTSNMEDGLMKTKQMCYVTVNMRAPSDSSLSGKKAVNQHTVHYDAYSLVGSQIGPYNLPSDETYVQLLDTVGKLILQKTDADNTLKTEDDGSEKHAPLTGAKFMVYGPGTDPNTAPALFTEARSLNSLGRLVVNNIPFGTYWYEEVEAPAGYEKITGKKQIIVNGANEPIEIPNKRIPGEVILTKKDADNDYYGPLAGAEFELWRSDDTQVFTDKDYKYSETGDTSVFVTGSDGTLHVAGLPWGSYYFTETKAPKGYEMQTSKIRFSVTKAIYDPDTDKILANVEAEDPEITGSIRLTKTDSTSGAPVDDAVYALYRKADPGSSEPDKELYSGLKTNAVGEIEIDGLKFGDYYFVETRTAGGYKIPTEVKAKTDTVTLDADNAGEMVFVTHTNDRETGTVTLEKKDDFGQYVGGAEYTLYKLAEGETAETSEGTRVNSYTTESDKDSDTFGTFTVKDLEWGDYYFVETKAPMGYAISPEKLTFTVDRKSVQGIIYVDALDERQKGTIRLTKTEKDKPEVLLAGAEYELYKTDGTLLRAPDDYTAEGRSDGKIITGDGSAGTELGVVTIKNIKQGSYYLKEVKAPENYSLSEELIRFSVTLNNADITQNLKAEDEKGKAVIVINKEINELYAPFGAPTFIFQVTGDASHKTYTRSITISERNEKAANGHYTGSVAIEVDQGESYTIKELEASRYLLKEITDVRNMDAASMDVDTRTSKTVTISATNNYAEVTYYNEMTQYEKFSSTGNATNMVKASRKLTGIKAEFNGPDPLQLVGGVLDGWDSVTETYTFQKKNVVVTAFYDDGTSEVITDYDMYSLSPDTIDEKSNSATVEVTYTEPGTGTVARDSFSVGVDLPITEKCTVTYHLNGGSMVVGSTQVMEDYTVRVRKGQSYTIISATPTKTE